MCLLSGRKIKIIADKDIVCCKYLNRISDGKYVTPYQGAVIKINSIFEVNSEEEVYQKYCNKFEIEGGAIHACINIANDHIGKPYKAIIPQGTEIYVDDNLNDIAVKKLYITDEKFNSDNRDTKEYIFLKILELAETHNNVRIGDVYTSTHEFVHSNDIRNSKHNITPIGVVSSFDENGKPIIISLKETCVCYSNIFRMFNTSDLNNGKINTLNIINRNDYSKYNFPAFYFCNEYTTDGTNKGDWYLGSENEVREMELNIGFINIAISYLIDVYGDSVGVPLGSSDYYWSSSEEDSSYAMRMNTCSGYVYGTNKRNNLYVRAWLRVGA